MSGGKEGKRIPENFDSDPAGVPENFNSETDIPIVPQDPAGVPAQEQGEAVLRQATLLRRQAQGESFGDKCGAYCRFTNATQPRTHEGLQPRIWSSWPRYR